MGEAVKHGAITFEYDVAICYPILLHYVRTPYRSFHSASYHALYNQGESLKMKTEALKQGGGKKYPLWNRV